MAKDRHGLGLGINLPAFHTHPLRHYTRLALCLSPKGSSILFFRMINALQSAVTGSEGLKMICSSLAMMYSIVRR